MSKSLTHTGVRARVRSWYIKAKDSAVGSSFDSHVVGGYQFLMRFYNPGDEIYMFGFSRGAYIARFLAEMLDYVGLLSHGNEEMVRFAWKAFSQWQSRSQPSGSGKERAAAEAERDRMYSFMRGFRETFSRPVGRIRFLGLFDTVNSVPRFETAWMQRSRFPYTARSSAKVIRHAVSIDERRAKFRQDLMYQENPTAKGHRHRHMGQWLNSQPHEHHHKHHLHRMGGGGKDPANGDEAAGVKEEQPSSDKQQYLAPSGQDRRSQEPDKYGPYRARSKSRQRAANPPPSDTASLYSVVPQSEIDPDWDEEGQDIDEVWFSGGHADVGGGWEALDDRKSTSHIPLTWMVREARKAGLPFDMEKMKDLSCWYEPTEHNERIARQDMLPNIQVGEGDEEPRSLEVPQTPDFEKRIQEVQHPTPFHEMMHKSYTAKVHDSLEYGQGLPAVSVFAWKFMENIPFRRMNLNADGSWGPIRWPLPRGEVRDIPDNVRVHGSVIRRMELDENYRPGNLIIGGGGRGQRFAHKEYDRAEWVCVSEPGDPIGEVWVRKHKPRTNTLLEMAQQDTPS